VNSDHVLLGPSHKQPEPGEHKFPAESWKQNTLHLRKRKLDFLQINFIYRRAPETSREALERSGSLKPRFRG